MPPWSGCSSIVKRGPLPGTDVSALKPGGRIHEFDKALVDRLGADGYAEPAVWWGQTHHHVEQMADEDLPPGTAGRALSIYCAWTGRARDGWLGGGQYDDVKSRGVTDVWPIRDPLRFLEGDALRKHDSRCVA
ncbi:MAG: hypothetical protein ACREIT_01475 [Tepidisphaeraceae bacterium]